MKHVGNHLRVLQSGERTLADAMQSVSLRHRDQPDVAAALQMMREWSYEHAQLLDMPIERYRGVPASSSRTLASVLFKGPRKGTLGLLRDLQDLAILAHAVHGGWTVVDQAAAALRDDEIKVLCDTRISQTLRQIEWLDTQIKQIAPSALISTR